jgi:hypothetical protein
MYASVVKRSCAVCVFSTALATKEIGAERGYVVVYLWKGSSVVVVFGRV